MALKMVMAMKSEEELQRYNLESMSEDDFQKWAEGFTGQNQEDLESLKVFEEWITQLQDYLQHLEPKFKVPDFSTFIHH